MQKSSYEFWKVLVVMLTPVVKQGMSCSLQTLGQEAKVQNETSLINYHTQIIRQMTTFFRVLFVASVSLFFFFLMYVFF